MKSTSSQIKTNMKRKLVAATENTAMKGAGALSWFFTFQPKVPAKLRKR